jgi:hypothetical protein
MVKNNKNASIVKKHGATMLAAFIKAHNKI